MRYLCGLMRRLPSNPQQLQPIVKRSWRVHVVSRFDRCPTLFLLGVAVAATSVKAASGLLDVVVP
eukprot:7630431-Pyramimonas_sp.AAC.1